MSLRINTNIAAEEVQKNLRKTQREQSEQLQKLSSGERINNAADDATGLALSTKLEAQIGGIRQATRNANDGISMIQTAEGGMSEVSAMLMRMRELSVQSASDVLSDQDREYAEIEFQQLVGEIDRIANVTTYNGVDLLNGEAAGGVLSFHIGQNSGPENVIEYDAESVDITSSNLGIDGSSVASKDNALDAMEEIDQAVQSVSSYRSFLGATQRRMQSAINNLDTTLVSFETGKSQILDTDVAEAAGKLASANIKRNAGIAVLAQANNEPYALSRLIG